MKPKMTFERAQAILSTVPEEEQQRLLEHILNNLEYRMVVSNMGVSTEHKKLLNPKQVYELIEMLKEIEGCSDCQTNVDCETHVISITHPSGNPTTYFIPTLESEKKVFDGE